VVYLTRKRASGLNAGDRRGGSRLRLPPPRQPLPPGGRFSIDTVPGERSSLCCQCEDSHRNPVSPRARYPDYRQRLPAPLRGREEAAERPGGGGDRLQPWKTVFSDTSRQERGESSPPPPSPSAPPPRGRFPIDTLPGSASTTVSRLIRVKILFPPPGTVSGLSPETARPLEGAGGGRGAAGRRGCFPRIPFNQRRRRQERGEPSPPPPSPSAPPPRGRFPIDTVSRDLAVPLRSRPNAP